MVVGSSGSGSVGGVGFGSGLGQYVEKMLSLTVPAIREIEEMRPRLLLSDQ